MRMHEKIVAYLTVKFADSTICPANRILVKINCTGCHGYTYLARRKHPKAVMAQRVVTTLAPALTT